MENKILIILEKVSKRQLEPKKALYEILDIIERNKIRYTKCDSCDGLGYHIEDEYDIYEIVLKKIKDHDKRGLYNNGVQNCIIFQKCKE